MNARPLPVCNPELGYTNQDDGIHLVCDLHGDLNLGFGPTPQVVFEAQERLCTVHPEISEEEIKLVHPDYPTPIPALNEMYEDHAKRVKAFYAAD